MFWVFFKLQCPSLMGEGYSFLEGLYSQVLFSLQERTTVTNVKKMAIRIKAAGARQLGRVED